MKRFAFLALCALATTGAYAEVTSNTEWQDVPPEMLVTNVLDKVGFKGGGEPEGYADVTNTVKTIVLELHGSNVVIAVTNAFGEGGVPLAEIRERDEGVERIVWSEKTFVTNMEDRVTNRLNTTVGNFERQLMTNLVNGLAGKAPKAWQNVTSAGGDAPNNTVYMTAPTVVFAGGLEFKRVTVGEGAIAVLTTKGAPVYTQGNEGKFYFQDSSGSSYFGFSVSDSYTLGCNTDGITTQVVAGDQIVTLQYDVTMSGVPIIYYSQTLTGMELANWERLNNSDGSPVSGASVEVTWEQNPPANTELCYINCGSNPKGFFYAKIEIEGGAKFETNMPADLQAGIMASNRTLNVIQKVRPAIVNGVVTWEISN